MPHLHSLNTYTKINLMPLHLLNKDIWVIFLLLLYFSNISGQRVASDTKWKPWNSSTPIPSHPTSCNVVCFSQQCADNSTNRQMCTNESTTHISRAQADTRQVRHRDRFACFMASLTSSWLVELESSPGKGM